LKKTGVVKKGEAKSLGLKSDVTVILSDETFVEIADGKTTGQKAFMTGALKTKGNMMLATKLDGVLKVCVTHTQLIFISSSLPRRAELTGFFCDRARRARRSSEKSYAAVLELWH
jgi:SCP-2 sterol transfer family